MDSFLDTVPIKFWELYRKNWSTIRQRTTIGKLKDVYHFPLSPTDKIFGKLDKVLENYQNDIKLNVAFGFVMTNILTGEIKFYHPSNNTMVFETAQLISGREDIKKVKENIEREDLLEIARSSRPSTAWKVEALVCIRFDVMRIQL